MFRAVRQNPMACIKFLVQCYLSAAIIVALLLAICLYFDQSGPLSILGL